MRKLLDITYILYFFFSLYMFYSYEKINDKMLSVNNTLLRSCVNSKLGKDETSQY